MSLPVRLIILIIVSFVFNRRCFAAGSSHHSTTFVCQHISVTVGEEVEFSCEKNPTWQVSASWSRLTYTDAKQCTKGFKLIKDIHWFCDLLVNNRIVEREFADRFSMGPYYDAKENYLMLKSASLEDSGRYFCFNNRIKEIKNIYILSVSSATTKPFLPKECLLSPVPVEFSTGPVNFASVSPSSSTEDHSSIDRNMIIVITIIAVVAVCVVLLAIFLFFRRGTFNKDPELTNDLGREYEYIPEGVNSSSLSEERNVFYVNGEVNAQESAYAEIRDTDLELNKEHFPVRGSAPNTEFSIYHTLDEDGTDLELNKEHFPVVGGAAPNTEISVYHTLDGDGQHADTGVYSLVRDESRPMEPQSNLISTDGIIVYTQLKSDSEHGTGHHTNCKPIANLFSTSEYAAVDHTRKAVPPPPPFQPIPKTKT